MRNECKSSENTQNLTTVAKKLFDSNESSRSIFRDFIFSTLLQVFSVFMKLPMIVILIIGLQIVSMGNPISQFGTKTPIGQRD